MSPNSENDSSNTTNRLTTYSHSVSGQVHTGSGIVTVIAEENNSIRTNSEQLTLVDQNIVTTWGFTLNYLNTVVIPYIDAFLQVQHILDEIKEREPTDIRILGIRYGSVTIDVTAGVRETIEIVLDMIVPWRRKNQRMLAELEVSEKEIDLKKKRHEIAIAKSTLRLETKQAEIENIKAEAEHLKLLAETRKIEAETRQQELANQKTQIEVLHLTLETISKTAPNLTDEQRLYYAMKLVDPTRLIATSPLELVNVQVMGDGKEPQKDSTEHGDYPNRRDSKLHAKG